MTGIGSKDQARWDYHDLMLHRIHEILLVASPYDAFILEEDGRLTEQILSEYLGMNLTYAPRAWRASTATEAMDMLSTKNYDLVIVLLRISDMDPVTFAGRVKEKHPGMPVILLAYDASEVSYLQDHIYRGSIDKVFVWSGNASVFPVIIKYIEDKKNAERDILRGDVRAIVMVEDNPEYYSRILPRLYSEILYHTRALMDQSLNATHRLLRLRARPKILFCSTFEEAQEYVQKFRDNLLGIISDIRFPRNGNPDDTAGLKLAEWVRELDPHMPFLLQSSRQDAREMAKELGVDFINKNSNTLLQELRNFMKENFGFGDFVFRDGSGKELARATNMLELEERLRTVSDSAIAYHATRNHFSNWLAARGEFWIASRMRPVEISDFPDMAALRQYLIGSIGTTRHVRRAGRVEEYVTGPLDPSANFMRIRGGSLGGKARGLAFANSLIESSGLDKRFPDISIRIPRTVVIGTDEFDEFMEKNNLWEVAFKTLSDKALVKKFVSAKISDGLGEFLKLYLKETKVPLAIRSSGLLEDMQYRSFAGMYATFMVSNVGGRVSERVKKVGEAVRLVYASTFSQEVKSAADTLSQRLEDEKMGVMIQEVVGQRFRNRFYPTFSGVAHSLNYYPVSYMKRDEGIVYVALGLGRTVVEGGKALRFSPKYPTILPQFYSTEAMLENSQTYFYALNMDDPTDLVSRGEEGNLVRYMLKDAEMDGSLRHVASVITPEDDIVRDSLNYPGIRVVTFANILKMNTFPLTETVSELLDLGHQALGCPVELEFAVNLFSGSEKKPEFCLLQIRPMAVDRVDQDLPSDGPDTERVVCRSHLSLGNGRVEGIKDIICVKPDIFDPKKTAAMAQQIGEFNRRFGSGSGYLLMGPGRWGSADPWLGIPVKWDQISRARVIVEVGTEELRIDPSFGSHFFQNVTSFRIGYLTVGHRSREDFVDWQWLTGQAAHEESNQVKWIALPEPMEIWIDGQTGTGIVLKPNQTTP